MSGATTNRLTSRALALALRGCSPEEATEVLLTLADSNRTAVEHAMLRIRRGLHARPSRVGEQAAASLELVLARVSSNDATVLAVGSRVV